MKYLGTWIFLLAICLVVLVVVKLALGVLLLPLVLIQSPIFWIIAIIVGLVWFFSKGKKE